MGLVGNELRSGDILAFSGRGCISQAIRFCSLGSISHVGLICPRSRFREGNGKDVCLVEATMNEGLAATEIERVFRLVKRTSYRVWHYPLIKPLGPGRVDLLDHLVHDLLGTPYDFSDVFGARSLGFGWLSHLMGAFGCLPAYRDNHELFCSEWVAMAHNKVGLTNFRYPSHWNPTHLVRWERWHGILAKPRKLV